MKKYIHPKIKVIAIDPEQAILQVCAVGGKYLQNGTVITMCAIDTVSRSGAGHCNITPKGYEQSVGRIGAYDLTVPPS